MAKRNSNKRGGPTEKGGRASFPNPFENLFMPPVTWNPGKRTPRYDSHQKETIQLGYGKARARVESKDAIKTLSALPGYASGLLGSAMATENAGKFWAEMASKFQDRIFRGMFASGEEPEQYATMPEEEVVYVPFKDTFNEPMPSNLPPIIAEIIKGCPVGFETAMLFALLAMFAAFCFSKVRALYYDGLHAPNLQIVIEGGWGQGKSKFDQIFKVLFRRIIEADWKKYNENGDGSDVRGRIIQTGGINITRSKFYDVLDGNKGVHLFVLETEILAFIRALKANNGLTYEHLRKAFENGPVYQNNKAFNARAGMFPVFLNYVVTGTPGDTRKFIKDELEGGTASRIIWTEIPESGRELPKLDLPCEAKIEEWRDQIDRWREMFCYSTDEGGDHACPATEIDLDYVLKELEKWLDEQYDKYEVDHRATRKDVRARIATIAFHCAIVIHMLFDNPGSNRRSDRKAVLDLTRYIADYCMARFLAKFEETQDWLREENYRESLVKVRTPNVGDVEDELEELEEQEPTQEEKEAMIWDYYQPGDVGYEAVGNKFGMTKDQARHALERYAKRNGLDMKTKLPLGE